MPSVELSALEAQVVLLAVQKKNAGQQTAQQIHQNAEQQFVSDVALITKAHDLPKDAQVSFHVENGTGTATWPDIAPAQEPAA